MLHKFLYGIAGITALILLTACQAMPQDDESSNSTQTSETYFWPWQGPDYKANTKEMRRQHKVVVLLERGDLAFSKDRLNAPEHDNALLYYYTALKLEPGNKKAFRGLNNVAERFRSLARTSHDNGNGKQTRYYLRQAEMVSGASDPKNIQLRDDLNEKPAGQNPRELDKGLQEKIKKRKAELKNNPLLQDKNLLKDEMLSPTEDAE